MIALHGVDAYQHLARLSAVDPGFDSDGVLTVSVTPPPGHYPDREALAAFYLELAASLTALSEVTSVGGVDLLPLGGEDASTGFLVEGRENDPRRIPRVHYRAALPSTFATLGVAIREDESSLTMIWHRALAQ